MRKRHEKILLCPCCGERAAMVRQEIYSGVGMRVICTGCRLATRLVACGTGFARYSATGKIVAYDREVTPEAAAAQAAALWNRRSNKNVTL